MSDINYSVWGTPDTWQVWSDSPTSNALWGTIRQGAGNYSNADFTDYPPTKIGQNKSVEALYIAGKVQPNSPIDNSIAYTAINNPDLPQCNVGIYCRGYESKNNPRAILDNSQPIPFAMSYYNDLNVDTLNTGRYQDVTGFDGFPSNASVIGAQSLQRWSPYAACNTNDETTWGQYNLSGYVNPILSFGIKSIIFEINVRYMADGYYETGTSTLKSYLNNTPEWLQAHKLVGAYLIPYYRMSTSGAYVSSIPAGVTNKVRINGINPMFFSPYICDGTEVYNYTGLYNRTAGSLPIYGKCSVITTDTSSTIASNLQENPSATNVGRYAKLYGINKGDFVLAGSGTRSIAIRMELDMSIAENVEYIMKGAAAYGLFFCKGIGTLGNTGRDADRWVDNDMYLGIIRSDGMTYGEYTHGLDNAEQPQYGWKSSTETPYVPGQNTNIYSQQTRIKSIGHIQTMTKRYVLDENAVQAMSVDMFAIMSDLSEQGTNWSELQAKSVDAFLVQNPIDCIVSLKKYPVKSIPKEGTLVNIQYGRYTSGSAAAYECTADVYTYAFTPKEIQPRFGDCFLDYEPYTSAELFIPYCGTVQLRMCDILGKTLQPFVCVDYHTGQCTGFVLCDGIVIETVQGTIAVDVPVTGIQTATVEGQLQNAANVARQARVNQAAHYMKAGLIVGAATLASPALGAMALASQIKGTLDRQLQKNQADYELTHTEAPQHIIGTSSSACGWIIDADTARLILYYPGGGVINKEIPPSFDADALDEFIALNGVATVETGQIKSHPGVMSGCKPMLSGVTTENGIAATAEELRLIEDAVFEGLIVPVIS